MPAPVSGRSDDRNEAMRQALRNHIIRERQKKKQEQEADAEVERQRKEQEQQQKQDVKTLGETREQIVRLEYRLNQLKEEKHELFLQLKKVLNEDVGRRRQLVKESNEVMEMYTYPAMAITSHPQLFIQQNIPLAGRNPLYKAAPATHTLQLHPGAFKRAHSPTSPPPANYHQGYGYKPGSILSPYQKVEDSRRGPEYVRAVLWNKGQQYSPFYPAATTVSYSTSQAAHTYSGPQYSTVQSSCGGATPPSREAAPTQELGPTPPKQPAVYMAQPRPPHINQGTTYLHSSMDHPKPGFTAEEKFYTVTPIRPANHVPIHGGAIPIQQPAQGAKTGGITSGYPIRTPTSTHSPHNTPPASTPHSVYVSQAQACNSRLVHTQAGIPTTTTAAEHYSSPSIKREA